MVTGQCLCGSVAYELTAEFAMTGVCHCKNCQRQAGSAFSTLGGVPSAALNVTQGELKLYQDEDTDSGNPVERYFCGDCGSPIYSALPGHPMVFVKTGTLDDTSAFNVQFHVWCDSKQPWVQLDEGIPTMAKGS